ncbi:MAG: HdeD family acid-resistance protein [Cyanobium sp.]
MNEELPELIPDAGDTLAGLTLAEGILLLVLGVLALACPILASKWIAAMLGIAFLVGGLVSWVSTLARGKRLQKLVCFWRLVVATLFVVAGAWIVAQIASGPVGAARQVASLAMALGLVFLIEGVVAGVVALGNRQVRGWGWGLTNGVVTLVLGLLILTMKPLALMNVLGVLVGISFLFSGIDLLAFSASFHRRRG